MTRREPALKQDLPRRSFTGEATAMPSVIALLGPTNTGKTYYAMERMLAHGTGMIGFPLRLLARENYDRLVRARGVDQVALVTGEERIIPAAPRYYVCTVEAMPTDISVDFLAVDEVQLAGDRERGHVFTDRLLHARGERETMFLGADTIRPVLRQLVPGVDMISRPRLSTLRYVAPRKLEKTPRRGALIVFSVAELYEVAERLRSHGGGAALVFGALSPRARNAQVGLYQSGEVDHLVATDAIGMGLNLDLGHVAFTSLTKHDGQAPRRLHPAEVGQIAGRAGRHIRDGTFGATTELGGFHPGLIDAVENHHFEPLRNVYWRNPQLSFNTIDALLQSLDRQVPHPWLVRMRHADDQKALEVLVRDADITALAQRPHDIRLLWDVCQIPDFRNVMTEAHTRLLSRVFALLVGSEGGLPWDWVNRQVKALDNTEGDIAALLDRISGIRTWTYVSHRPGWIADAETWQARTRDIENRLADTLHERLRNEYANPGATLIARQGENEIAFELAEDGTLLLQGIPAGRLVGFQFEPLPGEASRALRAAANRALRAQIDRRVTDLCEADDTEFTLTVSGSILWRGAPVGRLLPGDRVLSPQSEALASELLDPPRRERVRRRLADWVGAHIRLTLAPLFSALEAPSAGAVRGIVYLLAESLSSTPRRTLRDAITHLTQSDRRELSGLGIILGRRHVFMPAMLRPDPLRVRATLFQIRHPKSTPLPTGPVSLRGGGLPDSQRDAACGYESIGGLLVRVDAIETLVGTAHSQARQGPLQASPALAKIIHAAPETLPAILIALGFERTADGFRTRDPRPKPKPKVAAR
ncbi:MAG: helicase-related protein [Vicinamibacteria bacterium]